MKWIWGFLAGLVTAIIMVIIGFQEPVLDYFAGLLYYPGGDMQYAYMGALFGSWIVAAIVGIIVWIVVARWLGRRDVDDDRTEKSMPITDWVVVETVYGSLNGEILRGLLQARGIDAMLSQEGAGRVLGLEVGSMGEVDVLVSSKDVNQARELIDEYYRGTDRAQNELE